MGYYESLLRLCDRKLPVKARKDFHGYYNFNPHHRLKISPHHMMIKFVEISRELMSEYSVTSLTRKVLKMMIDFTRMERGLILLGGDNSHVVATHQLRPKSLTDVESDEFLCHRLAKFCVRTGRALNLPDISAVNLNEQFLPEEYHSARWYDLKAKSILIIPFQIDERILGVVYLDSRSRRPAGNEEEVLFLENFGMNVAIALNNAVEFSRKDEDLLKVQRELTLHREQLLQKFALSNFIGISEKTRELLQVVDKIADSNATALLTGESGVGKELIAKTIHYNCPRKNKPFVAINCAAIPEQLLESELFGHEKGSFTDAHDAKKGFSSRLTKARFFSMKLGIFL
jgi:transcriptional regulator with GAF, ATPase, and Fis domain